jgi:Leucine-rich repeat (LRR) protein
MLQHASFPRIFALLHIAGLSALLSACSASPFAITFGDSVLYTPNATARNSLLSDPALQGCLNSLLDSVEGANPANVKLLACPGAGVETLEGIAALPQLEQLELSGNLISDIAPLTSLKSLRVLSLRDNRVGNIGTLDSLPILRFVSLQGNDGISCRQLDTLQARLGNTLNRPTSCL